MNSSRRRLLIAGCIGVQHRAGEAAKSQEPLPAEVAQGPVEVDISELQPEQLRVVQWKNKPIWILRRSPEMIRGLDAPELLNRLADPAPGSTADGRTPAYARGGHRSIRPEIFVGVALCPHAGCMPLARLRAGPRPDHPDNWPGGFACQCHFATFDLAGRVFKGKPTEENIEVPRHMYLSDARIVIGKDQDGEA